MPRFLITFKKTEIAHTYVWAANQDEAEKAADEAMPEKDDISWGNEIWPVIEVAEVQFVDADVYSSTMVDRLKVAGRYQHAGALAYSIGLDNNYGCHYGMRSTYQIAMAQYKEGHEEARIHCEVSFVNH